MEGQCPVCDQTVPSGMIRLRRAEAANALVVPQRAKIIDIDGAQLHTCELADDNKELLRTGKYSDINVRLRGEEYRLHRAIVCPKIESFAIFCDSGSKGNLELIIDAACGASDFKRLLDYVYTLTYSDDERPTAMEANDPDLSSSAPQQNEVSKELGSKVLQRLTINATTYALADQLGVPGLKRLAGAKFLSAASQCQIGDVPAAFFDFNFRSQAIAMCTPMFYTLIKEDWFADMLGEHGQFSAWLLRLESARHQGTLKELEKAREEVNMSKADLEDVHHAAMVELDWTKKRLEEVRAEKERLGKDFEKLRLRI